MVEGAAPGVDDVAGTGALVAVGAVDGVAGGVDPPLDGAEAGRLAGGAVGLDGVDGVAAGVAAVAPGRRESGMVGPSADAAGLLGAPEADAPDVADAGGVEPVGAVPAAGGVAGAFGSDGGAFVGFWGLCVGGFALMRISVGSCGSS